MGTTTKTSIGLALALALTAPVLAANLDAPAAPQVPTTRSEVKRGFDTAFDCALAIIGRNVFEVNRLLFECVDAAQKREAKPEPRRLLI